MGQQLLFLVLLDTNDETGCMSRTSMQTYCINNHNVNIFFLLQDEKNIKFLYHQMRGTWANGWMATEAKGEL